tara:strand:- start:237 stop:929 length:693 start_codon:yes stop_codon:yes gene_type:complete
MLKFSLIIPVYNESENIKTLYNEIKFSEAYVYLNNIIFIDDASKDNSLIILNQIIKKDKKVIVLKHDINNGQSKSIKTGIDFSNDKYVITLDGDGQNDPNDIIKLIRILEKNKNISLVGGIRINRKDQFIKKYSSIVANKIRRIILNDDCDDTGCALKIFDREIFIKFPFFKGVHRFLPALFKGSGYKCYFINVNHRPRIQGKSNYGTLDRLFVGIRDIFRVKKILNKKQ